MRKTHVRLGAALLVAGLTFGATGLVAGAQQADPRLVARPKAATAATTATKVKIVDFAFSPKAVTISKGTRIKWVNRGAVSHTSTSNTGKWDSGTIAPGDSFSRVFRKAGTFLYHCSIHPTMKAKIIVK